MSTFFGRAGWLPVAASLALAWSAGCEKGTTGSGGGSEGGGSASGEIEIQNLSVTIDAATQQVRLTFILDNNSNKAIDTCNTGTITTSSGQSAVVDKGFSGGCFGFEPPEDQTMMDFCGGGDWDYVCSNGLLADSATEVINLSGSTDLTTNPPYAASGVEYTLQLQFVMADASLADVTATAVVP